MSKILAPGTVAPGFTLAATPDQKLSLSDLSGRPVVLAFYPADWSPVCGDQMALYNELLPEFNKYHAEVLGISVDGVWCHEAFAKDRRLHFPLLADFHPQGAVAKQYGAFRESEGVCERALFVIDREGVIFWRLVLRLRWRGSGELRNRVCDLEPMSATLSSPTVLRMVAQEGAPALTPPRWICSWFQPSASFSSMFW